MRTSLSPSRELVESSYLNDERVLYNRDESVTLPDAAGGDWHIEPVDGGGWTIRNDGDQGYVTDEGDRYNRRPKVFATLDGALFHIIGDPQ